MVCIRSAWLVMGTSTIYLEGPGYFCTSLDLGYPTVREVISDIADQNGADDRTSLVGSRAVTAEITALAGAGARIDDVADNFAPFMNPAQRPVLHYVLDRPGAAERILTLRASGYSWPIVGPYQRDIQLQWVAADPIARDPNTHTLIAWSGATTAPGRTYNLTFNRIYPPGGSSANTVFVQTPGDVNLRPLVRIYGPITAPTVVNQLVKSGAGTTYQYFGFLSSFTIDAGHWVDVDCARHTVYRDSDTTQPLLNQVNWGIPSTWLYVTPKPDFGYFTLNGNNTTGVTQAQVIWNDGYLT